MIDEFLAGNRRFAENEFSKHGDYYRELAEHQHPKILWIGCSDSRVSEDVITSSKPGSIFVHRNIANIVSYNDINIASIINADFVTATKPVLTKGSPAQSAIDRISP